ncbi:MAG: acetylglutamate kinase [Pseudomonadota bacterium]
MAQHSTRETIVQLLSNMSDGKEIRAYLNRFSSVQQTRFAVIKIGGSILRDELTQTASALAFLHTVGLTPIVLHGGGPQLDERLAAEGIETPKIDGLRVTSPAALDVARDVFITENLRLVEAVRAQGVDAHSVSAGVLEAEALDLDRFGLVGRPTGVRLAPLESVVRSGAVPILTCLGMAQGGQLLNINGDSATRALVHALRPLKIIFLSGTGGLLKADGLPLHSINLVSDYDDLMAASWVHSGMRLKLQEIKTLLDDLDLSASVSITSPTGLVRELFTHGGAGTLVRRGERIVIHDQKSSIDTERLQTLIEEGFQRPLKPDWFAGLTLTKAYVSENYRAGALITQVGGLPYLDKFAVVEDARGEGLARVVWRAMADDYPVLFWRSRTANGFNAFYTDVATGSVKIGPWTVFWMGDIDLAARAEHLTHLANLPEAFIAPEEPPAL